MRNLDSISNVELVSGVKMDEKKRKKTKKKNKSAPLGNAQDQASPDLEGAAAVQGDTELEATLASSHTFSQPAAVEGIREVEVSVAGESTSGQKDAASEASVVSDCATLDLRKDFELLVQDIRSSLEIESINSQSLLKDLKNSISGLQASLESSVKRLGEEVLQLKESTQQQRTKEVDLDGGITNLKEEICQLKALQERQQEREAAKHLEFQRLREEICSLREYNTQQFEKVEEMNMTIKQLLLERSQVTTAGLADGGHTEVLAVGPSSQESHLEAIEMSSSIGAPAETGGSALKIFGEANGHPQVIKNDCLNFVPYETVPEAQAPAMEAQARAAFTVDNGSYIKECPKLVENSITGQSIDGPVSPDCYNTYTETGGVVNEEDTQQEPQHIPSPVHHHDLTSSKDFKPFSDAPITGAPIRIFGFIARYVSGADLVGR